MMTMTMTSSTMNRKRPRMDLEYGADDCFAFESIQKHRLASAPQNDSDSEITHELTSSPSSSCSTILLSRSSSNFSSPTTVQSPNNEYNDEEYQRSVQMKKLEQASIQAALSLSIKSKTNVISQVNHITDDDSASSEEEEDDLYDLDAGEILHWSSELKAANMKQLTRMSDDEVSALSSSVMNGEGNLDGSSLVRQHQSEICRVCKKPLTFTNHNNALICLTPGCTAHIYNICDSTVASVAFGEEIDFCNTHPPNKPNNPQATKVLDEIYGRRNRVYINQKIIDYMRICIQYSTGKVLASEITVDDVVKCARAHNVGAAILPVCTQILCRMTGRKAPVVNEMIERKAINMYGEIKNAYFKWCKPESKTMAIKCHYTWYKIFERLGQHHVLPFIKLIDVRCGKMDSMFVTICKNLNWFFKPTMNREIPTIVPLHVMPYDNLSAKSIDIMKAYQDAFDTMMKLKEEDVTLQQEEEAPVPPVTIVDVSKDESEWVSMAGGSECIPKWLSRQQHLHHSPHSAAATIAL